MATNSPTITPARIFALAVALGALIALAIWLVKFRASTVNVITDTFPPSSAVADVPLLANSDISGNSVTESNVSSASPVSLETAAVSTNEQDTPASFGDSYAWTETAQSGASNLGETFFDLSYTSTPTELLAKDSSNSSGGFSGGGGGGASGGAGSQGGGASGGNSILDDIAGGDNSGSDLGDLSFVPTGAFQPGEETPPGLDDWVPTSGNPWSPPTDNGPGTEESRSFSPLSYLADEEESIVVMSAVPEPSTYGLMGAALLVIVLLRRRFSARAR